MAELRQIPVDIEDEMKKSYLDYAMSVIVGRALPNVRDGLKPAHRRILFAMYREGLLSNRRYSKCAGVVGEVLKKYHPHGDMAVYDTLVRMAQDFNMRYPLIDGQGNFGSIDGDPAAAYRYTEARLMKIAEEMLADIDKETVDFYPNFDESEMEPGVLPSKIPNLLVNGSSGIAVGMATNIPPHNMGEVIDACIRYIRKPSLSIEELMEHIQGPDFPTYGFIYGVEGIKQAYKTGRGIIQLRARAIIERGKKSDREKIVISEIPYMVNKAKLVEQIADLIRNKKIEGIADLRDESDRDGIRIVMELRRGETANVILNALYKHTQMQTTFGIIMLALVDLQPKVLDLRSMIELFVSHRKEVVTRRSVFDLNKAKARAHILEGLKKAIDHIDEIIHLIKRSSSPQEAKEGLIRRFSFSEPQAQSILEMRLQRLTALERDKIMQEHKELLKRIAYLDGILKDEKKLMMVIVEELEETKKGYGDARRTEIIEKTEDISMEDMIVEEDMVVTCSHSGYIKRSPVTLYRKQRRGGKGRFGMRTREEDFVELLFVASTHDYFLVFTRKGRVHWLKVHQIPQIGVAGKGKAIVNLLNLEPNEKVAALLRVKAFSEDKYIVMATRKGIIKKTSLQAYSNPRSGGIRALVIDDDDELHAVALTDGNKNIFLGTYLGKSIRFNDSDVRPMGRIARGVRGIFLSEQDHLVGMKVISEYGTLLTISERGYGKRSLLNQYRKQRRGGKGLINIKTTERNGNVVGITNVTDEDEIIIVTAHGKTIRTKVNSINPTGRSTQGVRLIHLEGDDIVVAMAKLVEKEGEEIDKTLENENATEA